MTYTFGNTVYPLFSRTYLMGIVNCTPDSFSDGGLAYHTEDAMKHALQLIGEGADFIDIGGESSRPGADPVSAEEEIRRVIPVVEQLAKKTSLPISIDTSKSIVAEQALQAGACIVNDITALYGDPRMAEIIAKYHASVILMHMQGTPRLMQNNPQYQNVIEEISVFLEDRIRFAVRAGISQIIVDPGIGFGKTLEHNLEIIRNLRSFRDLGYPLLVGPSRKTFIGKILDVPPTDRKEGTMAAVAASILFGANIIRIHDVKEMKQVAMVTDAILGSSRN